MRRLTWVLLLLASCAGHRVDLSVQAPATFDSEPGGYEEAVVTRAVDGDTIEVEVVGRVEGPGAGEAAVGESYTVRLLGIDTPESVSPRAPVECFGREAAAATAALLTGETVKLVKDVEERDGFDRLLRYVYVGAELANARLVANGYAHAYTYPPNVRWSGLFAQLEGAAAQMKLGLWGPDACVGDARARRRSCAERDVTANTRRHAGATGWNPPREVASRMVAHARIWSGPRPAPPGHLSVGCERVAATAFRTIR